MKKKYTLLLLVIVAMQLVFVQSGESKTRENLYSLLSDQKEVKTYVRGITDSSGSSGEIALLLKKEIETVLEARKSINFVIVNDEKEADIIISCEHTEIVWLEVDPIDMVYNVAASAHDALIEENYSRAEAVFVVEKGPRKVVFKRIGRRRILWDQSVQATVTKKIMPEDESIALVSERLVEVFIRKCFSRKAKV